MRQFDTLKRSEQEIWNATQGSVTGQPSIAVLSVVMEDDVFKADNDVNQCWIQ